jgi:hypothetical protein
MQLHKDANGLFEGVAARSVLPKSNGDLKGEEEMKVPDSAALVTEGIPNEAMSY